jgi:glycosyltransferase involved in cell wall biosynthesis
VPLPAAPLDAVGRIPDRLLFVGNFHHPPNVDAALYLVRAIFPRIRAAWPGATLRIVGAHPPPELRALSDRQVDVVGWVPNMTVELEDAAVVLAPMRLGGGMRVKVLEALAAGKAVIGSGLALRGLDLHSGREVVEAKTDQELVQAAVSLLASPETRLQLGTAARRWASHHLRPEVRAAAYEALYAELSAERFSG